MTRPRFKGPPPWPRPPPPLPVPLPPPSTPSSTMGAVCDRCRRPIIHQYEAVMCTHFGSLPTLSHRRCTSFASRYAPAVIFKFGVELLPFFAIVNVVNITLGLLLTIWGLAELVEPQESLVPTIPIGLMSGPFFIVIGAFLLSSIMKIKRRTSRLRP